MVYLKFFEFEIFNLKDIKKNSNKNLHKYFIRNAFFIK